MVVKNDILINDFNSWEKWNTVMLQGGYKELMKSPKRKEGYTYNWPDEDGTERDIDPGSIKFESRTLSLPFAIYGETAAIVKQAYYEFTDYIRTAGYFILEAITLDMQFKLLYNTMTDLDNPFPFYNKDGVTVLKFTIEFIDDYPLYDIKRKTLLKADSDTYLSDGNENIIATN